jgi:hypothetical protein
MPAMDLRVASNLASFGAPGDETPGIPAASLIPQRLPMSPRGRPGSCIFRPCRRWSLESPRISHPSAHPARQRWVTPQLAFQLRLLVIHRVAPASSPSGFAGEWSLESPRISHSSALPGLELWVTPQLCSSGSASQCGCELPRTLHLPALPWLEFSGLPEFSLPWLRLMEHPSCLGCRTLRLCRPCVFGLPRILHLRLGR